MTTFQRSYARQKAVLATDCCVLIDSLRPDTAFVRPCATPHGEHPARVPPPRFVYAADERVCVERIDGVDDPLSAVRYTYHRLCFKAAVIEPLNDDEVFEVITPEGVFRMMKAEFYADFSNVVASPSYRDRGLYHYPKTPKKALKYLA